MVAQGPWRRGIGGVGGGATVEESTPQPNGRSREIPCTWRHVLVHIGATTTVDDAQAEAREDEEPRHRDTLEGQPIVPPPSAEHIGVVQEVENGLPVQHEWVDTDPRGTAAQRDAARKHPRQQATHTESTPRRPVWASMSTRFFFEVELIFSASVPGSTVVAAIGGCSLPCQATTVVHEPVTGTSGGCGPTLESSAPAAARVSAAGGILGGRRKNLSTQPL